MSEADEIIRKLNTEQRNYLNRYFAHAPESVTGSMQVIRMPEGTTFIQEGTPVDKVYILLKGCVSAVDYRVRETVYGFCHFDPIETFGTMEILGHMNQYRTTLATTRDSLFLKIPRDAFEKWILKDVDALQMETERIIGYLLDQSYTLHSLVHFPGCTSQPLSGTFYAEGGKGEATFGFGEFKISFHTYISLSVLKQQQR